MIWDVSMYPLLERKRHVAHTGANTPVFFCSGSFCFMSWCLKFFCAVGALCMFSYF